MIQKSSRHVHVQPFKLFSLEACHSAMWPFSKFGNWIKIKSIWYNQSGWKKTSVSVTVRQFVKNWVFEYGSVKSVKLWKSESGYKIRLMSRVNSESCLWFYDSTFEEIEPF